MGVMVPIVPTGPVVAPRAAYRQSHLTDAIDRVRDLPLLALIGIGLAILLVFGGGAWALNAVTNKVTVPPPTAPLQPLPDSATSSVPGSGPGATSSPGSSAGAGGVTTVPVPTSLPAAAALAGGPDATWYQSNSQELGNASATCTQIVQNETALAAKSSGSTLKQVLGTKAGEGLAVEWVGVTSTLSIIKTAPSYQAQGGAYSVVQSLTGAYSLWQQALHSGYTLALFDQDLGAAISASRAGCAELASYSG
jgi:hypothetical protein